MSVLVTGAGGAIGAEIVRQLLADGKHVVAQDLRPLGMDGLEGAQCVVTTGDLLDDQYRQELAALLKGAPLDAVIAAHGIDGSASLDALTREFTERVMAVNARSVTLLFETCRTFLLSRGGVFVVIASQAGLSAEQNNAAYCASKFALVGWVRALAPRLDTQGVKLRAFCPGCTETPLLYAAQERFAAAERVSADFFIDKRRSSIPIERFADVAETAAGAIYLAEIVNERPAILAATGGEVLA